MWECVWVCVCTHSLVIRHYKAYVDPFVTSVAAQVQCASDDVMKLAQKLING